MVEVRLVGRQVHQGVRLAEPDDRCELVGGVVDTLVGGLDEDLRDVVDEVDDVRRVLGGDLLEIPLGPLLHPTYRAALLLSELLDAVLERAAPEEVFLEESRHLVAGVERATLGPIQRERRLTGDEKGPPRRTAL